MMKCFHPSDKLHYNGETFECERCGQVVDEDEMGDADRMLEVIREFQEYGLTLADIQRLFLRVIKKAGRQKR